MYNKTFPHYRITDCTDQVRRLAKQNYKVLPEEDVIFLLERLVPAEEVDETRVILAEALSIIEDALASVRGQGKRVSMVINYDYGSVPEVSRLFFAQDKLLASVMETGNSFHFLCLYAEHQSQLMTKTLAAMIKLVTNSARFAETKDAAMMEAAKSLGMQ